MLVGVAMSHLASLGDLSSCSSLCSQNVSLKTFTATFLEFHGETSFFHGETPKVAKMRNIRKNEFHDELF